MLLSKSSEQVTEKCFELILFAGGMEVVLFLIRSHHKLGQLVHKTKYLILVKHRFKEKYRDHKTFIKFLTCLTTYELVHMSY